VPGHGTIQLVDCIGQTIQARDLWLGLSEDASIEQGHQTNKLVTLVVKNVTNCLLLGYFNCECLESGTGGLYY